MTYHYDDNELLIITLFRQLIIPNEMNKWDQISEWINLKWSEMNELRKRNIWSITMNLWDSKQSRMEQENIRNIIKENNKVISQFN